MISTQNMMKHTHKHTYIKRFQQPDNWIHHTTLSLFTIRKVPQKLIALEMLQYFCKWVFLQNVILVSRDFKKSFNCKIINLVNRCGGFIFSKINHFCCLITDADLEDNINNTAFLLFFLLILKVFPIPDNLFCFH